MNPLKSIFKNTAVLGMAKLLDRAGGVLLAFFVSRIFHASGLGVYTAVLAYFELISAGAEMGATNLLVREIGKDRENTSRYIVHLGIMASALAAVLMLAFFLALPYLGYASDLKDGLTVIILAIIPATLNSLQEGVFVAHQRVEFVTYTSLINGILNISVSIFLLLNGYGIVSLIVAFVLVQYLEMFLYYFFIQRYLAVIRWEFNLKFAWRLIHEVKSFAGLAILAGLFSRPEVIILSLVSSTVQIGFYSAALKIISLWQFIPQIFMTNVFPVLSRSYHLADDKAQAIQDQSVKYLLALSLPIMIGIMVAAGPIINGIFGPGFEPAVLVLQVSAFNVPLIALFAVLWRVLAARGQQGLVLRAMVISTALELICGFVLISRFGANGAAVNSAAISVVYVMLLALYIKQDGTPIAFWRTSARFGVAALGMGVLAWLLSHVLQLWLLIPVAAAAYVVLVILLQAFSQEDLNLFRNLWESVRLGRD